MRLRSLLFVPGDSERKFEKGASSGADALIFDLEDAVAPTMKDDARQLVSSLIEAGEERDWSFLVRMNPLSSGRALADLAAVVRPGLDGVVVPKVQAARDLIEISHYISALEVRADMEPGSVKLIVVATETASATLSLADYHAPVDRLVGLTWGAEDLAAEIGATRNKLPNDQWTMPFQIARTQALFAATAAGVAAIDTLYADYKDTDGLAKSCQESRRDGFIGRIAIHPGQVETINREFTPSEDDVKLARRIVDAFDANPDAGTLGINGAMYDIPHLKAAKRTLAAAANGKQDD